MVNESDPEIQSAWSWNKVFQPNIFVYTFAEYFKQKKMILLLLRLSNCFWIKTGTKTCQKQNHMYMFLRSKRFPSVYGRHKSCCW